MNYLKLFLLFLIPSIAALSIGFYNNYSEQKLKIQQDFFDKYTSLAKAYAIQASETETLYESMMKMASIGLKLEVNADTTTNQLKALVGKYGVTHLFLIGKDGSFFKSTNESPDLIPNLYSFSSAYRDLIGTNNFLITPIIVPTPERTPHKFFVTWNKDHFLELGYRVDKVTETLSDIVVKDTNITLADLSIGNSHYTIKGNSHASHKDIIKINVPYTIRNKNFAQSNGPSSHTYKITFHVSQKELTSKIESTAKRYFINFSLTILLTTLSVYFSTRYIKKKVQLITSHIQALANEKDFRKNVSQLRVNKDLSKLIKAINRLLESFRESSQETIKNEKDITHKNIAMQVAHDIRSPLEALKSSKLEIARLPEQDKRKISLAINRIEEIAFSLLKAGHSKSGSNLSKDSCHAWLDLEEIIIEKRMQYNSLTDLEIQLDMSNNSVSSFINMSPGTFKRIISNLVSNAVEADLNGTVIVSLTTVGKYITINIIDSGPGFSNEAQTHMFKKGFTTKDNGNGLGLYSAHTEVHRINGSIKLKSTSPTNIEITLPTCSPPEHHQGALNISNIDKVVIIDDDPSTHEIWKNRFNGHRIELLSYFSIQEALAEESPLDSRALLLCDYEFEGEKLNGLELIEILKPMNAIIVSAKRIDDFSNNSGAKFKFLSKSLCQHIPISEEGSLNTTIALIDDDKFIHAFWRDRLTSQGVKLHTFFNINEFLGSVDKIPKSASIFIDSDLKSNQKGEVESEHIFKQGYNRIFLSTGFSPSDIDRPYWILDIVSKDPGRALEISMCYA